MPLPREQVDVLAGSLEEAERKRTAIAPLSESQPELTMRDAYAVQRTWISRRLRMGERVIGWKVGLTSVAMQRLLGVHEPDFGHLLHGMLVEDSGSLRCADLIWPRVEPEIAFRLRKPLRGPGVTAADVLDATSELMPALEIVDSRIRDWKIQLVDTIADNASCGRFVLGSEGTKPGGFDLRLVGMNFFVNDELTSTATGAAVLGDPAAAVAWLCNTLAPLGESLAADQVIMPGSLVAAVDARPGALFRADFDRLGSVTVRMV